MIFFSLNSLIDDILLIVRNNNISESEDLSRAQIEQWIHHYRAQLIKQDESKGYDVDVSYAQILELELEKISINDIDNYPIDNIKLCDDLFKYKTIEKVPKPLDFHYGDGFISVSDLHDCTIQKMSKGRRRYQWLRRTGKEYTYHYLPGYIYVQGLDGLRYIRVVGVFEDPTAAGLDPDAVYPMPVDKIGPMKQIIFDNELKFMLSRPSDDKNNASLAGLKPDNNE